MRVPDEHTCVTYDPIKLKELIRETKGFPAFEQIKELSIPCPPGTDGVKVVLSLMAIDEADQGIPRYLVYHCPPRTPIIGVPSLPISVSYEDGVEVSKDSNHFTVVQHLKATTGFDLRKDFKGDILSRLLKPKLIYDEDEEILYFIVTFYVLEKGWRQQNVELSTKFKSKAELMIDHEFSKCLLSQPLLAYIYS